MTPATHPRRGTAPDTGTPGPAGARATLERWRRPLGALAALGATALAATWVVVVPDRADDATGLREIALRWGHPLCWVLLAGAAGSWSARAPRRVVEALAWLALACYGAFIAALTL